MQKSTQFPCEHNRSKHVVRDLGISSGSQFDSHFHIHVNGVHIAGFATAEDADIVMEKLRFYISADHMMYSQFHSADRAKSLRYEEYPFTFNFLRMLYASYMGEEWAQDHDYPKPVAWGERFITH